jgi:hypothetical protein
MKDIQLKELQRAIKFIDALGCAFKIITADGQEFGALEVKAVKDRKRGPLRYPYGEIAKFYKPQLNLAAEIGDVQEIAVGKFSPEDIRSGVCSLLSKEWGKDSYTTSMTDVSVEVLRVA